MKVGLVGLHYPRLEHQDGFVPRATQAAEVIRTGPGCLSADCWVTAAGAVTATVQCQTEAAMAAPFAAAEAAGVDLVYDERESRPREIHRLTLA